MTRAASVSAITRKSGKGGLNVSIQYCNYDKRFFWICYEAEL